MKFISTKIVNNERMTATVPFDADQLGDFLIEEDVFTFTYDLSDVKTKFSIDVKDTLFIAKLNNNMLYLSTILYVDEDSIYSPYAIDEMVECAIEVDSYETTTLMGWIIKHLVELQNKT